MDVVNAITLKRPTLTSHSARPFPASTLAARTPPLAARLTFNCGNSRMALERRCRPSTHAALRGYRTVDSAEGSGIEKITVLGEYIRILAKPEATPLLQNPRRFRSLGQHVESSHPTHIMPLSVTRRHTRWKGGDGPPRYESCGRAAQTPLEWAALPCAVIDLVRARPRCEYGDDAL